MRPYIIAHMLSSLDGRIDSAAWTGKSDIDRGAFVRVYEDTHRRLAGDAWIVGRTTMEEFADGEVVIANSTRHMRRETFKGASSGPYALVLDPSGKLHWSTNTANGDHVIEILTEQVPDSYLEELQSAGVSYIFAGTTSIDLGLAMTKLREEFGIERLLLEGGGRINGSFLAAGLVDEFSLLLAPVLDATPDTPASFDHAGTNIPKRFVFQSMERRDNDLLWLRYVTAQARDISAKLPD
jgi:2,5-diamino-6-(ribosylamino)-4(3H)-pyrimidinone 5'-phosphate reductase